MDPALEDERTLPPGGSFDVVLEGRPGAGYRWAATSDRPGVASVDAVLASAPDPQRRERFRVVARAPGTATLAFALRRPFGPDVPPLDARTMRVRVTSA